MIKPIVGLERLKRETRIVNGELPQRPEPCGKSKQ
jgi:hypothetical protein